MTTAARFVNTFRQMRVDGTLNAWCDQRLRDIAANAETAKRQLAEAMTGDEIRTAEENVARRLAQPTPPPRARWPRPRRAAVDLAAVFPAVFPDLVGGEGRDALHTSRDPHPQPETLAS